MAGFQEKDKESIIFGGHCPPISLYVIEHPALKLNMRKSLRS
jgi:hypothetical protein